METMMDESKAKYAKCMRLHNGIVKKLSDITARLPQPDDAEYDDLFELETLNDSLHNAIVEYVGRLVC